MLGEADDTEKGKGYLNIKVVTMTCGEFVKISFPPRRKMVKDTWDVATNS